MKLLKSLSVVLAGMLLFATLSYADVSNPVNGTVTFSEEEQRIVFTPSPGFYGDASFQYEVTDKKKGGKSTATVHIFVKKKNLPPVAVDDYFETEEDMPLIIPVSDLLKNDSDPDGDPLFIIKAQ